MIELKHPEALLVGGQSIGGSQEWYPKLWQRKSGCGPTNAALLVWYMARTRPSLAGLCETGDGAKADFVRLMQVMFGYVTPRWKGVNTYEKFAGLFDYLAQNGAGALLAPDHCAPEAAAAFIQEKLLADCPVAFLNLDSGSVRGMDSWHWMTVIGFDAQTQRVKYCDQGEAKEFLLPQWIETSKRGGLFVSFIEKN
ncbi:MAG: hypothetical protein LBS96_08935 [Oscillospiraceae bacterium]|jgi:hypothetical protein|nr:hypothetical protein [Oscillospiraceae bacterium]